MSTRSNINVQIGNQVHRVYVHNDGYPTGVGERLLLSWKGQEKAEKLIAGGDMSYIGANVNRNFYYGRERGETGIEPKVFPNIDQAWETRQSDIDYVYYWDGSYWYVRKHDWKEFQLLADVLNYVA